MLSARIFLFFLAILSGSLATKHSFWRGRVADDFHGNTSHLSKPLPSEKWFVQQSDPYYMLDNKTFHQRYYVNTEFFKSKTGPVFLFIGREGPVSSRWMVEGAWLRYAQELGALCLQIEHRFYGRSYPTGTTINEDCPLLSSEIALTDIALFIREMQTELDLTPKSRWIVFGGGYGGSLAAWLRVKFPHLVHGAVSSSAPLLGRADFSEYYNAVENAIVDCRSAVQEAFRGIEKELETSIGRKLVSEQFKLSVVQYNGNPYFKHSIKEVCNIMNDNSRGTPFNRLAALNKIFLKDDGLSCMDYKYDKMINELKEMNWEEDSNVNGTLHWMMQLCKEFGWFPTINNASHIFGNYFPIDFFLTQCSDAFRQLFNQFSLEKSISNNNVIYGGIGIKATNTIYVYGDLDPWRRIGLSETKTEGFRSILIHGTAHCADMYEPRNDDPSELKEARQQIQNYIAEILNQTE
ncbi:putative serine protease F56F10.1 [Sergentomyia squamirostris]